MPQTLCSLGGYTFPYNPYPNINPTVKSTSYMPTIGGGYQVVWLNSSNLPFNQDSVIRLQWRIMESSFYNSLQTLFTTFGTMTFVDENGKSWTVLFIDLTFKSKLLGGDDAYEEVEAVLRVAA